MTDKLPKTMKAWRFHTATGGAEKHMKLETIPLPKGAEKLPAGSTLVKVIAVCLNPVDIKFSEAPVIGGLLHPMPAIPGLDGVGRVACTTSKTLKEGQLVSFRLKENRRHGALAEYVVVPWEGCVPVPEGVSPIQAATTGTCGATACQAIAPYVGRKKQDRPFRVFINGGSGGTGSFQLQVAKALGCYVATSCSTPNIEACERMGADKVIDYRLGPVSDALVKMVKDDGDEPFDLVVDNQDVSWQLYKAADEYLHQDGTYVQVGASVHWSSIRQALSILFWPRVLGGGHRKWTFVAVKTSHADAERVLHWMAEGKMTIPIDQEFEFADVPFAYGKLQGGHTRGKIVVWVDRDGLS